MNLEDTKVIAEFIGRRGFVDSNLYTFKGLSDLINDTWYKLEDAKFHKDWNWLMLVVKKVDSYANEQMTFAEYDDYRKSQWRMIDNPSKYDIQDVCKQVVQFLRLDNQTKTK